MQVAEQEAKGIAQLAVELGAALHQVFACRHVLTVVDRGDPEANDFAAVSNRDKARVQLVDAELSEGVDGVNADIDQALSEAQRPFSQYPTL